MQPVVCCLLFFVVGKKDTLLGDAFGKKKHVDLRVCVLFMGGKKKRHQQNCRKVSMDPEIKPGPKRK